ncbi:MAG: DUF4384 domain-containing protein [Smithellaceae bacterium]|jgi:hypothetical protein|nr:DUF4384 domain-containing protein [Smithellaceae bacterium]MDD3848529.1 DUF4384 domain-containing protein [Smithellaceae bacterium]HOG11858.1 DUF4384 domain-containing protein [Smithellaceae bacterium]HOQ71930.1 DUF4384 domain-containing protein [Smithellaceae bacterium]HPL09156.1 DUF4384 domain-containing protein [Smithellaceae bacterium]
MRKILFLAAMIILLAAPVYAAQSTIKIAEGSACMGDDKSRKQTETAALADAKRNAVESVKTYVSSATEVKDFELQKDLVSAYANATVEVLETLEKGWYKDPGQGDCYRIKLKAEVIPDEKAMKKAGAKAADAALDDPSLPLTVKVWTDKTSYAAGEKIRIYLKGNKPFFARVIYRDAVKNNLQLLPNPYRRDNYFQGGVIYEIPSGKDQFELEVNPPFGEENIIVYASVSELGDLKLKDEGSIFAVQTRSKDIGVKTRSVKIKAASDDAGLAAEFSEVKAVVKTRK